MEYNTLSENTAKQQREYIVKATVPFYLTLTLIAIVIIHFHRGLYWQDIVSHREISLYQQIFFGTIVGISFVLFTIILKYSFSAVRDIEQLLKNLIGDLTFLDIVILAFFSGIAEEMFFRGALQPILGLVATSIIFGIIHFIPTEKEPFLYPSVAIGIGFVLGYLFYYTEGLLAPITAHILINMIGLYRINNLSYTGNIAQNHG